MGLGLTKQLVELHGGTIEVSSVVNQGSIFTVWLPNQRDLSGEAFAANEEKGGAVNAITGTANGVHAPLGTGWAKKSVMLIDGDGERPLILCNLLTAAGHDVVWVDDGAMAIAQFKAIHPDLVVLSLEAQGRKVPLSTAEHQSGEFNPLFEQLDIVPTLRQRGGQRLKILVLGDQARGDEVNWWLAQWTAPTAGVTLGDRPLIDAYLSHQSGSNEFLEVVTGLLDVHYQMAITDPTTSDPTTPDSTAID